jgi:hypothetical protein
MQNNKGKMTLDECEDIFDQVVCDDSEPALCSRYQALLADYPIINVEPEITTYWRGRKCDTSRGYKSISELAYPPTVVAKTGRLNAEGNPCFYATVQHETVLSELQLQPDNYVHIIGVRCKPLEQIRYIALGELYNVHKTGYMRLFGLDPNASCATFLNSYDPDDANRILFIDAFFRKILSDPNASLRKYVLTRCLAAEAFKKIPEAEGLFYPSVQVDAGMCLALKPSTYDQKMRIVSSHVLRISRVRPFGFYDYDVCMEATGISDSGEFIWREPRSSRSRYYFNLTKEEAENHSE